MKPDESRTPTTPIPLKHRHELDHAAPTIIHDPEQDMPLLERWLRHALENPGLFWGGVALMVVLLAAVSLLTSGALTGGATGGDAWTRLEAAKNSEDREKVAADFPKTPAERAALLQVASEYYMRGFSDLPQNRDVALPTLKKALDRYQRVADEAPADSPQARVAALGVARTLEARNELDKALAAYDKVAKNPAWKDTPEARAAAELADALRKPEAASFYKELYTYKAPELSLPPGDTGRLPIDLPGLPAGALSPGSGALGTSGLGGLGGSTPPGGVPGATSPIKLPDPLTVPPPPPARPEPETKAEPKAEPKTVDLVPAAPKAETPKTDAPKGEPTKPAGGLPDDPFAPAKK